MRRTTSGQVLYSPSDLVCYLKSPFASWMDRYCLEHPGVLTPDEQSEAQQIIAHTGIRHEQAVLDEFKASGAYVAEIPTDDRVVARRETEAALQARAPIIYQAALEDHPFAGFADFLLLDRAGHYQVWDAKLARSPKPYYVIQLCCYSQLLAGVSGDPLPRRFGIILGNQERVEFRIEDFLYYYRRVKLAFLAMQDGFTGDFADRPEPLPRADHGRWASLAEQFFTDTDSLVRVAGITVGQIKKLKRCGITTMHQLAAASGQQVPKLERHTLEKLTAQARVQCLTCADRANNPDAPPRYEVLPQTATNGVVVGIAALPPDDPADVFFDMEGYPLVPGGLEYLFGACTRNERPGAFDFLDWWAHDRDEEKSAFEGFVDWVYARWLAHPSMHIYHYASYEVSAVRRLSTRHDTRQEEIDQLLRNNVFVDLYQVIRHSLLLGEDSYSIKRIERLYRPKRATDVATAVDSIVQYSRWIESGEPRDWRSSGTLGAIREYNEDDCRSTGELLAWLRKLSVEHDLAPDALIEPLAVSTPPEVPPEVVERQAVAAALLAKGDEVAQVLGHLVDYHRREQKPIWWRMFDRAAATPEDLCEDSGCIHDIKVSGNPRSEKKSLVQPYVFDPDQECKLAAGDDVIFTHNLKSTFTLLALDIASASLELKMGVGSLKEKFAGAFPPQGSLIKSEIVSPHSIPGALKEIAQGHLSNQLRAPVAALLNRVPPGRPVQMDGESTVDAAIRLVDAMSGGCLVIQGPPGTGKTYTASRMILALLAAGKRVGVASNSHKAVVNLIAACGEAAKERSISLRGIKVGDKGDDWLLASNPELKLVKDSGKALAAYTGGVVGGTAWLFTRPEWEDALDFLFIDEAGQVCLANAVAMARCTSNLVLLGDQMQLEQPVQGSHPGDAGLSALQYALKDLEASRPDAPVFHAVVPRDYGLFLGESRRMHPAICRFISESIYDGHLRPHADCARQRIRVPADATGYITQECGIVFSGVEHDGNIQQCDEEAERVEAVFHELQGRLYTASDGTTRPLGLEDFLFIAPYNAQVRALQRLLPKGARVGSVDKFQGQEAPVCVLSLCSSYGEYGSRGLAFILDRNRINVAISRAQCMAVVVADPRIASAAADTLQEMMLLNLFCKIAAASAGPSEGGAVLRE